MTLVFAGGGSGGHIAPGLAIIERVRELDPSAACLFVCSERPIDARMLSDTDVAYRPIPAMPLSLRPAGLLRFIRGFGRGRGAGRAVLRETGAAHVVLLGGFVAAPMLSAARAEGVPSTMVNLDDPPGKANRMMAPRCAHVLSAVELPDFPGWAEAVVGMPIRRSALTDRSPAESRRALGLEPDRPTLLVTGASQGATTINELVSALAERQPEPFRSMQVLHLAGPHRDETVREAYRRAGVPAVVMPFLDRMGLAWGAADLAVSRCGASSVAEAVANAVPTLFLPYPYHRDLHQARNVQPWLDRGAASMALDHIDLEANLEDAGARLVAMMREPAMRARMKSTLREHQPADAALTIARRLLG